MSLTFYMHPLASFCHKVLIALYENETPFEARHVDLADPASSAELRAIWPVGKIPLLRDEARQQTIPETTIQIEYLAQHYPGPRELVPQDLDYAREARLWDRFCDVYLQVPMQKVVGDMLRPEQHRDPFGVAEARSTLGTAYEMLERQLQRAPFIAGPTFTLADCSAAPALFYAQCVLPFAPTQRAIHAYFEALCARPSFQRVIDEARPYFSNFPLHAALPKRFL